MESGHFGTEDDMLREAIDTLEKRQRGLAQLREMVDDAEGDIAAGRVGPFDTDETKATVRARLETRGIDN